jgi:hypothetical protein
MPRWCPVEAASKHAKRGMIWPPAKTSMRKPPAAHLLDDLRQSLGRALKHVERGGQAVDIRHWTFGWAIT